MKTVNSLHLAIAAGLSLGAMSPAWALTASGTTISNTASVAYKVATVDQTPVDSNTASFVVDRLIDLDVAADNSPVTTVPGATGVVAAFTVTNNSNDTLDFTLAVNETGAVAVPGGTDDSSLDGYVYVVDDGDGIYEPLQDLATSIDDLPAGSDVKVFVIASIEATAIDGEIAGISLQATATETNGDPLPDNTTDANTAGVDTVFADGTGAVDGDNDASYSAYGSYVVETATVVLNKTVTIISDPVNGTTDPKAIPGAVIEYCLAVKNTGSVAADTLVLTDGIPVNTTYVAESLKVDAAGLDQDTCTAGSGTDQTDDADADAAEEGAPNLTYPNGFVTIRTPSVSAAGVFRATFQVTVD